MQKEISEYIEVFYNLLRKRKRLRYLSPAKFKQRHYALPNPLNSTIDSRDHRDFLTVAAGF
jgi:hypothetical protein